MQKAVVLILVAVSCLVDASPQPLDGEQSERIFEDAILSVPRLIRKYGYPVETHEVTTEDGHILQMFRIPYGKQSPAAPDKPVVFLQHGLLSCSADWVIMGTEKGFGYILADLGYDVWLGNSRGTTYSRKHTTLDADTSDGAFWNFSWHEMGIYDLPAAIDYVLAEVDQEKLFYVGHSQGTTQFYVMASEKPEYNDKIRAMFSLAPIGFMHNVPNPFLRYLANVTDITLIEELFGAHEFLPHSAAYTILGDQACRDGAVTQVICENVIFLICGYDSHQLNATMLPVIMGHLPAGASTKSLVHYAQEIVSARFSQFDYHENNTAVYGTDSPPDYDLSKITAPVALHYGYNDWLAATVDVKSLHEALGNSMGMFLVPLAAFNHVDFTWGIDVKTLLYDLVIKLMEKY